MTLIKNDFSVLNDLNLDYTPVGIKFFPDQPDMVSRLDDKMALCEMLKLALEGNAFFVDKDSHTCEAGLYILGQSDGKSIYLNGEFGAGLKIFDGTRSASRLYQYIPRLDRGIVNYISFSPIDRISIDPDLLIILADTRQTEIFLRAMSYKTGKMWSSKFSAAIGCAWTYIYPYKTGELNYSVTGLGHGMRRRRLYPEGKQIISIPYDIIPSILTALGEMEWELPAYKPDGLEFVKNLIDRLETE